MSGARRREPSSAELPPLHVAASRGCLRCLRLLLREQRRPERPDQDGKPAVGLALEQGTYRWHSHGAQDGPLMQDPGGARCSLSFLTEDGTDGSVFPADGLLSSTRRSLLEELEGGCSLGDPPRWQGCPQPLSTPSSPPWPHTDPEGPPQPLASSTLLGPEGPPQGAALSSCPVACQHRRGGDSLGAAAQHHPGVPQGPPTGWAGLGSATLAATGLGTPVLGVGARGQDQGSPGDSSGDSEVFVSAMETLGPGRAGGGQGAQPWAAREPEPGETPSPKGAVPSPKGAAPRELPPASPRDTEQGQGEDLGRVSGVVPRGGEGSGRGESGELLAQLQGCSIQDGSPCTPEPLSSFSPASGHVTPQGQGSPGHRHVTPRTKSRLRACAQRFSSSSSSSLFDETLEMPRRPPRLRAPQGVPRGPATTSGHCVTLQDEDGERTTSWDDTEVLPGSPPGASSSATPTVLLLRGDHQHPRSSSSDPQGSPSSGPTVLLLRGDHQHPHSSSSDPQGSPSSGPTVLLLRGDHQHPHSSSSAAQGSPSSGPTVLLLRGDHQHPHSSSSAAQGSPSSGPTVLLLRGDHQHPHSSSSAAQGSPSSGPTVLLLCGDHQHPRSSSSDPQGSPSSGPTVLLLRGDHQHPHSSSSDPQGSPSPTVLLVPGDQDSQSEAPSSSHAAGSANLRVLEGGSGWQDPSPLRAQPSPCPHASVSHLLAPRLLGGTAVGQGSSARLPSPPSCSSSSEEPPEDEEQGQAPAEQHRPGTEAAASPKAAAARDGQACPVPPGRLSDAALRRRLRALGDSPGPITELTRGLYLRRLQELARAPRGHRAARAPQAGHSPELVAALSTGQVPDCTPDELALAQHFDHPGRGWHWREGLLRTSFNYLLLDPRTTQNLPLRAHCLSPAECFSTFIQAIFYVGKGTRARPYCHLTEALSQHRAGTQRGSPKVRRILEIWASGQGVVSLHCFQSCVPAEAYTRESCLVEALGLQTITNQRPGRSYGAAARWAAERRRRLGVHLLHRALRIFLAEGERQLRPADIQGGR